MNLRSKSLFLQSPVAALALAASTLWLGAASAHAQFFSWDSALSAGQVERMVQASGYRLTGPVVRRGPVYIANVVGRDDDPERLVIDAHEGRLLQRTSNRQGSRKQIGEADASARWQQPQTNFFDGWFGGDNQPPRPPASVYGDTRDGASGSVAPLLQDRSRFARTEADPNSDSGAQTGFAPNPSADKARQKPQVKRHRPGPATAAVNPAAPSDAKPASPTPSTPSAAPTAPPAAAGASSPRPETPPAAPVVADANKGAAATPPRPADTPAPKAPAKHSVNDVPVAPLE